MASYSSGLRVLLLIVQFPPDVNSTGLLMGQVCEELIAHGHQVSVLTTFPHYAQFRIWDEYRGKLIEHDHYRGMDVTRVYVHAAGSKQSMVNRFLSYLSFNSLATVAGLLSRTQYDVILATNGSFFSGVSAWLISKARGIPYVYNIQDLYPETPIRTGKIRHPLAIWALRGLERFMYRRAAHLSVITPSFRAHAMDMGLPDDRISVVPNFVDTSFIRPLPKRNPFSERHDLADKFVITHAGNVGYVYDLETMLDAAALLSTYEDIMFLIVGDGVSKAPLQAKARALGLRNVRFLPFQPHADLPWLRAASDVQVSLYRHGSSRHSMASKIYEIMSSGRPLLASADVRSDVWNLVKDTGCGLCVEPEDAEKLAVALLRLYHDRDLCARMGGLGRAEVEQRYSRQVVGTCYNDLLEGVAARQRADRASPRSDGGWPSFHVPELGAGAPQSLGAE
jgi:colanic acid biosynthesis glycosyl transferase WcaI